MTGTISGLDNVLVYKEATADNVGQASDNVVGFGSYPSASPVTVTFGSSQTITTSPQPSYFVVLSPKASATGTVGAQIADNNAIARGGAIDTTALSATPISSTNATITTDTTAPDNVTNFNANDGETGQSTLTWTNPSNSDLAEVQVHRRTDRFPTTHTDNTILAVYDNTAAGHVDGDQADKRMKSVNSQTYAAANNTFCASACHGGLTENAHYANTQTALGDSDDGIYCMTCHNPHGQNGNQDAMIRSTIQGQRGGLALEPP